MVAADTRSRKLGPDAHRIVWPAADVVDLTCCNVNTAHKRGVGVQQIVDKEHIAHLLAVAVDANGASLDGGNDKPGHPTLILDPKLSVAIDAALTHDDGAQTIDPMIVAHILVAGALGATIGRMEIERLRFGNATRQRGIGITRRFFVYRHFLHPAINFIRARVDQDGIIAHQARRFQHIESAEGIAFKILARILHRRRHRHLAGQMVNTLRPSQARWTAGQNPPVRL